MRKILLAALTATAALVAVAPANAAEGCGAGFHRGPYGHCRPERGAGVVGVGIPVGVGVGVGVPVTGGFYRGRGYWDGRRYWGHRDRWHGGWRYR